MDEAAVQAGRARMAAHKRAQIEHEQAEQRRTEAQERRSTFRAFAVVAGCLLLLMTCAIAYRSVFDVPSVATREQSETTPTTKAPRPPTKDEIRSLVTVKTSWRKDGFGNVMIATFTIKNGSKSKIKDPEILCRHFAKSGTEIDSNRDTIYVEIAPGKAHVEREHNMGLIHSQAQKTACEVVDLVVVR